MDPELGLVYDLQSILEAIKTTDMFNPREVEVTLDYIREIVRARLIRMGEVVD